ncbi:hypothetical protein KFK09_007096 [Dendrobium nobile]|uniref:H(+)-transporting two-sector ATPase n=1 Tax=Dendrobium nobile TaxID=94219 RepID=A0A8T3BR05_DENNO|nr:hypothetical protein KFK09_007096 [Dendrobium nobile]
MDDLTDPTLAMTFAHLYATTILLRGLAAKGIYPTVDPLDSMSTMLQPRIISEEYYETAQRVKQTSQHYKELRDIIAILWLDKLSIEDHFIVARARKNERFLSQPFFEKSLLDLQGKMLVLQKQFRGFNSSFSKN